MAQRKIKILGLFLLLTLILSCKEDAVYRLGFIGTLSGGNSDLGEAGRNGFLLAVEEVNEAGGINGRRIEVIIRDEEMNPDMASRIIQEFKELRVEAVVGPFTSSQTKAALMMAEKEELLLISPTASSMDFIGKDDMLIRINSSTTVTSSYYSEYMLDSAGLKTTAILYDLQNINFTESWKNEFRNHYEVGGGEVVLCRGIDTRLDSNIKTTINDILTLNPESLLLVCNSIDSANIIQQLRQLDSEIPVIASEWAGTIQLIELGGKSVDGTVVLQSFDLWDSSPAFLDFNQNFHKRFQTGPTFASVMAYDAVLVMIKALESKQAEQSLKEAILEGSPFEGIQGDIVFDRFGDSRRRAVVTIVKNGQFRKLE